MRLSTVFWFDSDTRFGFLSREENFAVTESAVEMGKIMKTTSMC